MCDVTYTTAGGNCHSDRYSPTSYSKLVRKYESSYSEISAGKDIVLGESNTVCEWMCVDLESESAVSSFLSLAAMQ